MTHPPIDPDNAWRGILALYDDGATRASLLERQDREGLDIVLHLFMQWAAAQGLAFGADEVAAAAGFVAPWRAQVVAPIRALRRALPAQALPAGPLQPVRERLLEAELAAERGEVALLCAWVQSR